MNIGDVVRHYETMELGPLELHIARLEAIRRDMPAGLFDEMELDRVRRIAVRVALSKQ